MSKKYVCVNNRGWKSAFTQWKVYKTNADGELMGNKGHPIRWALTEYPDDFQLIEPVGPELTLRDRIAMAALPAVFTQALKSTYSYPEIAVKTYKIADAMLAERKK